MPHVQQHLFGPGQHEMLRLDVWTQRAEPRHDGTVNKKIKLKLVGQYDIYCGMGNMHRMDINITDSVWSSEALIDGYARDIVDLTDEGFPGADAKYRIVSSLLEWDLDEWTDPCDTGEEDEDDWT